MIAVRDHDNRSKRSLWSHSVDVEYHDAAHNVLWCTYGATGLIWGCLPCLSGPLPPAFWMLGDTLPNNLCPLIICALFPNAPMFSMPKHTNQYFLPGEQAQQFEREKAAAVLSFIIYYLLFIGNLHQLNSKKICGNCPWVLQFRSEIDKLFAFVDRPQSGRPAQRRSECAHTTW